MHQRPSRSSSGEGGGGGGGGVGSSDAAAPVVVTQEWLRRVSGQHCSSGGGGASVPQLAPALRDPALFPEALAALHRTLCAADPRRRALEYDRLLALGGIPALVRGCCAASPSDPSAASALYLARAVCTLGCASSIKFAAQAAAWGAHASLGLPQPAAAPPAAPQPQQSDDAPSEGPPQTRWADAERTLDLLAERRAAKVSEMVPLAARLVAEAQQAAGKLPAEEEGEEEAATAAAAGRCAAKMVALLTTVEDERCVGRLLQALRQVAEAACDVAARAVAEAPGFPQHLVGVLCTVATPEAARCLLDLVARLCAVSGVLHRAWVEDLGVLRVALEVKKTRFCSAACFDPDRQRSALGCSAPWLLEKLEFVTEMAAAGGGRGGGGGDEGDGRVAAYAESVAAMLDELRGRCLEACCAEDILAVREDAAVAATAAAAAATSAASSGTPVAPTGAVLLRTLFLHHAALRLPVARVLAALCDSASPALKDRLAAELYRCGAFADTLGFLSPPLARSVAAAATAAAGRADEEATELVDSCARVCGFVGCHSEAAAEELLAPSSLRLLLRCHAAFPGSELLTRLLRQVAPLLPGGGTEDLLLAMQGDPRPDSAFASAAVRLQCTEGWAADFAEGCGYATVFDALRDGEPTPLGLHAALDLCCNAFAEAGVVGDGDDAAAAAAARADAASEVWRSGGVETLARVWAAAAAAAAASASQGGSSAALARGIEDRAATLLLGCVQAAPRLRAAVHTPQVAALASAAQGSAAAARLAGLLAYPLDECARALVEAVPRRRRGSGDPAPPASEEDALVEAVVRQLRRMLRAEEGLDALHAQMKRLDVPMLLCRLLAGEGEHPSPLREAAMEAVTALGPRLLAGVEPTLSGEMLRSAALNAGSPAAAAIAASVLGAAAAGSVASLCGNREPSEAPLFAAAVGVVLRGEQDAAEGNPDWLYFLSACGEASMVAEQALWDMGILAAMLSAATMRVEQDARSDAALLCVLRLASAHAEASVEKRDIVFALGLASVAAERRCSGCLEAAMLTTALRSDDGLPTSGAGVPKVRSTWHAGIVAGADDGSDYFASWEERMTSPSCLLAERIAWCSCAASMACYFDAPTLDPLLRAAARLLRATVDAFSGDADKGGGGSAVQPNAVLFLTLLDVAANYAARQPDAFKQTRLFKEVTHVYRLPVDEPGYAVPAVGRNQAEELLQSLHIDFNSIRPYTSYAEKTTVAAEEEHAADEKRAKAKEKDAGSADADAPGTPAAASSAHTPGSTHEARADTAGAAEASPPPPPPPPPPPSEVPGSHSSPDEQAAAAAERRVSSDAAPTVGTASSFNDPQPLKEVPAVTSSAASATAEAAAAVPAAAPPPEEEQQGVVGEGAEGAAAAAPAAAAAASAPVVEAEESAAATPSPETTAACTAAATSTVAAASVDAAVDWKGMPEMEYLNRVKVFRFYDVMTQRLLQRRPSGSALNMIKELRNTLAELEEEL